MIMFEEKIFLFLHLVPLSRSCIDLVAVSCFLDEL
jgi:hypothetical protein